MQVVINTPRFIQPPALPYFAKHLSSKKIIMVQQVNFDTLVAKGTVVSGGGPREIGYFGDSWSILSDPKDWEVLPNGSTITFIQEI